MRFFAAVGLIVFLWVGGCTPPVHLFLHNHSQHTIRMESEGEIVVVPEAVAKELVLTGKRTIKLYWEDQVFEYLPSRIPIEFWHLTSNNEYEIHLQLEPNAEISVLSLEQTISAGNSSGQPSGYPLKPLP